MFRGYYIYVGLWCLGDDLGDVALIFGKAGDEVRLVYAEGA